MSKIYKDAVQITTAKAINKCNKEFWNSRSRNFGLKLAVTLEEDVKGWDIDRIVDTMITADTTINKSQEKKPAKKKAVKISDYNKRSIEF